MTATGYPRDEAGSTVSPSRRPAQPHTSRPRGAPRARGSAPSSASPVPRLTCPSCQETYILDADTPRQVFDPDVHRFACPACLAVLRLLPYPSFLPEPPAGQSDAEAQAAAVDMVTHPLCASIGVYDPVEGGAGRDERGVIAVYLYLPVPPVTC